MRLSLSRDVLLLIVVPTAFTAKGDCLQCCFIQPDTDQYPGLQLWICYLPVRVCLHGMITQTGEGRAFKMQ